MTLVYIFSVLSSFTRRWKYPDLYKDEGNASRQPVRTTWYSQEQIPKWKISKLFVFIEQQYQTVKSTLTAAVLLTAFFNCPQVPLQYRSIAEWVPDIRGGREGETIFFHLYINWKDCQEFLTSPSFDSIQDSLPISLLHYALHVNQHLSAPAG